MQGYFFSKPMPGAEVMDFLDSAKSSWRLATQRIHARAS
jgi:hypothetical protein